MRSFKLNPLVLAMAVCTLPVGAYAQDAQDTGDGTVEEVVVTGSFRDSLANAVNIKKNESGFVDAIVASDIAEFPDNNLAESLQRIPGVAISRAGGEGRNITVRGLGPGFTTVRLNGMETISTTIAIKSGRNADGRRLNIPSENILISHCNMRNGHGGVVIGSEISGGVRNVFVENCVMSSPELERGIRIKTNSVRGGLIENLFIRDVTIGEVQTAIVIDFDYEEGDAGKFTPTVRNIDIRNLICQKARQVFQVRGYKRSPIQNLQLSNCHFKEAGSIGVLEQLDNFSTTQVTIKGVEFKV